MKTTTLTLSSLAASITCCILFPSFILAAPDAAEVTGDLKVDGIHFSVDGNVVRKLSDLSSPWTITNTDIYFQGGNVGIGTPTPTVRLDVVGDAAISGTLTAVSVTANNLVTKTGATMTGPLTLPSNGFIEIGRASCRERV